MIFFYTEVWDVKRKGGTEVLRCELSMYHLKRNGFVVESNVSGLLKYANIR